MTDQVGGGRYAMEALLVHQQTNADAAVVIVINGNSGTGAGVSAPPHIATRLPQILEGVARKLRIQAAAVDAPRK